MTPLAIVSYDDTTNDHDALMLGRLLRQAGARLQLAYVRHAVGAEPAEELRAQREAEARLLRGAGWLEDPALERRVVVSGSTGDGLRWLADTEAADVVVFGSEYRTSAGHVAIGRTAGRLLEGGASAVALAPAGLAATDPATARIGVLRGTADEAAIETAFSLAAGLDGRVIDADRGVDLLVVGSRPEGRPGRVTISSRAHNAVEQATCPVLVVARDVPVFFETLIAA